MKSHYSCPECGKTISGVWDSDNIWLTGMAAYTKEKCQFCSTKIKINGIGFLSGFLVNAFTIYLIYLGILKMGEILPPELQDPAGILGFALIIPVGFILFYLLLPFLLGVLGIRLYEIKNNKKLT